MPQPYNYSLGLPDPTQRMMETVKFGTALKASRTAADQQAQLQTDLAVLSSDPSPAAITRLAAKYPQLAEGLSKVHDLAGADQKQANINQMTPVYAALRAGDNEVAVQQLRDQADAYRNDGKEQDAKRREDLAKLIELHPETATTTIGLSLSAGMGADKFTETFSKLETDRRAAATEKAGLTEAQAKARKAAVDADFAESNAVKDLEKKGWDIYKIQEDTKIAKENSRIAAMQAGLSKETNELKRQELEQKIKDAKLKRDQKIREDTASAEGQKATIDNQVSTIDRVLKNPAFNEVFGAVEGSILYPSTAVGVLPFTTSADERADAVADIDTIKSQTFINQLIEAKAKGATFGNLSENEGKKLESSLQSLTLKQSEKHARKNLNEIKRLLVKARGNITKKYGVPETPVDNPEASSGVGGGNVIRYDASGNRVQQ